MTNGGEKMGERLSFAVCPFRDIGNRTFRRHGLHFSARRGRRGDAMGGDAMEGAFSPETRVREGARMPESRLGGHLVWRLSTRDDGLAFRDFWLHRPQLLDPQNPCRSEAYGRPVAPASQPWP